MCTLVIELKDSMTHPGMTFVIFDGPVDDATWRDGGVLVPSHELESLSTFDSANTRTWQRSGKSVFLLEDIPGRWVGRGEERRPDTKNKYAVNVQSYGGPAEKDEAIAQALCDFLNTTQFCPARVLADFYDSQYDPKS